MNKRSFRLTLRDWFGLSCLFVCTAGLLLAPTAQAQENASTSIGGTVTSAMDGSPIAGAHVTAEGLHLEPVVHTDTDETGAYLFESLPANRWLLRVEARGFVPAQVELELQAGEFVIQDFALEPLDATRGIIAGRVIDKRTELPLAGVYVFYAPLVNATDTSDTLLTAQLANGALDDPSILPPDTHLVRTDRNGIYRTPRLPAVRHVVIAWQPRYEPQAKVVAVIGGDIVRLPFALKHEDVEAGAIKGKVFDVRTGRPIAGARVFYGPVIPGEADPAWAANPSNTLPHVVTDRGGEFVIKPLRPGMWHLLAVADGYQRAHQRVSVEAGETTEVRFGLEPNPSAPPGAIAGRVQDAITGAPIAGAVIFYGPLYSDQLPPEWWRGSSDFARPHVITNDQGEYKIENLRPGTWHLQAYARDYESQHQKAEVRSDEVTIVNWRLKPIVHPAPGTIVGHVFGIDTQEPISGARVYYKRVPSEIDHDDDDDDDDDRESADERNSLAPQAWIAPMHPYAEEAHAPYVETADDGSYAIPNLRPGRWHLLVVAEDYQSEGRMVTVPAGATVTADFKLMPLHPEPGTVFGRVIDAVTTQPLVGAFVWVLPAGEIVIQEDSATPLIVYGHAITDENGEYKIPDIPAGRVRVLAAADGYRQASRWVLVPPGGEVQVDFALRPLPDPRVGHLAGNVADATTLEPLENALVVVQPIDEDDEDDEDSETALYRAWDDDDNHREHHDEFDLDRPFHFRRYALTDASGNYAIRNLPIGQYKVVASKRGYKQARQQVEILQDEITRADFLLEPREPEPAGALAGTVTDAATSAPLAGVWIRLKRHEAAWHANTDILTTRTNELGQYLFPRVRTGEYRVTAALRGYIPQSVGVRIESGQTTVQDFALEPVPAPGAVEGTVRDALSQEPLHNALVFVPLLAEPWSANEYTARFDFTDEQGQYRIENVPAGTRPVIALAVGHFPDAQLAVIEAGATTIVDFELVGWPPAGGPLDVMVLDAQTRRPVQGARVHVPISEWIEPFSAWDFCQAATLSNGQARLEHIPPHQALFVSASGYEAAAIDIPDTPGGGDSGDATLAAVGNTVTVLLEPSQSAANDWPLYQ